jgi:5-methylcytosine-specific restriction endonuclease McrA
MARAPKICPRCPNLQPCAEHERKPWEGSTRRRRLPRDWEKRRRYVLQRDPVCKVCNNALSVEVDHIVNNDDHRYENLQGICTRCHDEKTQREAAAATLTPGSFVAKIKQ